MQKPHYSLPQIASILAEIDRGIPAIRVSQKSGISLATLYRWKQKYGGMNLMAMQRFQKLEQQYFAIKHIQKKLASSEKALNYSLLTLTTTKQRSDLISAIVKQTQLSETWVCKILHVSFKGYRHSKRLTLTKEK